MIFNIKMNLFTVCSIGLLALLLATPSQARGCVYIAGKCARQCPEGTHGYSTGCGHKKPEPTCAEPNPVPEPHIICDYSSCYCDAPTVRDPVTQQCIPLDQCPNASPKN